jgi:hypothetical protein
MCWANLRWETDNSEDVENDTPRKKRWNTRNRKFRKN